MERNSLILAILIYKFSTIRRADWHNARTIGGLLPDKPSAWFLRHPQRLSSVNFKCQFLKRRRLLKYTQRSFIRRRIVMSDSSKHARNDDAGKSSKNTSSKGNSPVEMTPFDVTPQDAAWKDRTERDIRADNKEDRDNAIVDEASELSFPASDPIAVSPPTRLVKDKDGNLHPAAEEKPKNR
jgi:hypothetical protein